MFKVLLISVVIGCCAGQLTYLKSPYLDQFRLASPYFQNSIAYKEAAVAQPIDQVVAPFQTIRTQHVLPIQDLDARGFPTLVRSDPVFVDFRTQSAPFQIKTTHVPTPPQEVTVTKVEDEPHRVIHEVVRPVIQEIREIIQPYRKITQEIRPVQEEIHTEVAGTPVGPAAAPAVAVAKSAVLPTPAVVEPTIIRAPAPALVPAPAPAVVGNLGVIASPAPLYTSGSYIQQFIEQMRSRLTPAPFALPKAAVVAPIEPIPEETSVPEVVSEKVVPLNKGNLLYTRKFAEY